MTERLFARRQTLKYLGILAGTSAGREFLAGWLSANSGPEKANAHHHSLQGQQPGGENRPGEAEPYVLRFFSPDEFKAVEALAELIIPTDETPGAKEAQVARYIDFLVSAAAEFRPSLQHHWTQGLKLVDRLSREKYGRAFHEIPTGNQETLLMEMSLPERKAGASHPGFEFYRLVKEMTVEGFYTSRIGLNDVLGYKGLAVLDDFPGCTHPEHQA